MGVPPELILIQGVLINGMGNFEDGTRAATAARKRTPSLTVVPSDCAVLLRSWRTKDGGIMRELPLSMRVPIVSPANNG